MGTQGIASLEELSGGPRRGFTAIAARTQTERTGAAPHAEARAVLAVGLESSAGEWIPGELLDFGEDEVPEVHLGEFVPDGPPARKTISVISAGAKSRMGGPQKPVPRLT